MASGAELILVIDLIMPRPDGSGIFGGLELLEEVRREFPGIPLLVMSDHPESRGGKKASGSWGCRAVASKPRKNEIRGERAAKSWSPWRNALPNWMPEPANRSDRPMPPCSISEPNC